MPATNHREKAHPMMKKIVLTESDFNELCTTLAEDPHVLEVVTNAVVDESAAVLVVLNSLNHNDVTFEPGTWFDQSHDGSLTIWADQMQEEMVAVFAPNTWTYVKLVRVVPDDIDRA